MNRFVNPDAEQERKFLDEEASRKGFDWSKVFWKPKPTTEEKEADNIIRILPARAGSGATYHARIGKHFIKHGEGDTESFICMAETYGKPCPVCERRDQIYAEARVTSKSGERNPPLSREASAEVRLLSVKRLGLFNVIDRIAYQDFKDGKTKELPSVKIWEAPRKVCWEKIVRNVASKGRMSNLFDVYDESGAVVKPGRDVFIRFYPESDPGTMYDIQYIDPTPLGEPQEVEEWYKQIIDLLPEKIAIYQPVDYDECIVRMVGTKEERMALREERIARYEKSAKSPVASAEAPEEVVEDPEAPEEVVEDPEAPEEVAEDPEAPEEAEVVEEAPKAPAPKAPAPKPTPPKAPAGPATAATRDELKARIQAVKDRLSKGK